MSWFFFFFLIIPLNVVKNTINLVLTTKSFDMIKTGYFDPKKMINNLISNVFKISSF